MSSRRQNLSILVASLGLLLTVQSGLAHDAHAPPGLGEPFRVDWFGRWSYAAALAPYYLLLASLAFRYRIIPKFATWKFFFAVSALLFMPVWEFFHSCYNHDWVYNLENTFPAAYSWRGTGIPISEFFGYITTATTFQALMLLFIRQFGRVFSKNYQLVPFSQ